MEEFFKGKDRDYDGLLCFEEFIGEESPIEKLFRNMDKNGDGKVSKLVIVLLKKCSMLVSPHNLGVYVCL